MLRDVEVADSRFGAADRFVGLEAGGVGVDSGHGNHVISATGLRHAVSQGTLMEVVFPWVSPMMPYNDVAV